MISSARLVPYFAESASCAFWGWILYRRFVSSKPLPGILGFVGKFIKFCLVLIAFGLLAVASGPVFALNAGHWQPTPQDLAAPPKVADR